MQETTRLIDGNGFPELGFVEREETPKCAMKLGIQLHLVGLSLADTTSILSVLGVDRCRSTVHNWVQKADLQPTPECDPDHVAVDETVIQANNERWWLYAAVDPATNQFLHVRLFQSQNAGQTSIFLAELREKHPVDNACFSSMAAPGFTLRSTVTASISDGSLMEIGTASNACFRSLSTARRRLVTTSDTLRPPPLKHGCKPLPSASTSLSEHGPK